MTTLMTPATAAWLGWQVGMVDRTVTIIRNTLWNKFAWARQWPGFGVSDVYDQTTADVISSFQTRVGLPVTGIADYATQKRLGSIGAAGPRHVLLTAQGTGQPDPEGPGYPADMGRVADPTVWLWQPVGNWPATAFPMDKSYNMLVDEYVRLLTVVWPWQTFGAIAYSQSAIGLMILLNRARDGDLKNTNIWKRYIGGTTYGNPAREAGHTFPGGIDPGGAGIVSEHAMVNTPVTHWDFACGKTMRNSPGQDLYATCGQGESAAAAAYQKLVWHIVDTGSFKSVIGLAMAVFNIIKNTFSIHGIEADYAATVAALNALDFFVVKAITPHTSYQFIQPSADPSDTRDAWRIGLDHINELGHSVAPAIKPIMAAA